MLFVMGFKVPQSVSFTDTLFSFPISNFKFQRIQWKRSPPIKVEREQYPSVLFFTEECHNMEALINYFTDLHKLTVPG